MQRGLLKCKETHAMSEPNLIPVSFDYAQAFAAFYQDFAENDPENANYYAGGVTHFRTYVENLILESQAISLPQGHVPCSHFWLINDRSEILGALRVRHHLNNAFLAYEGGHIGYDIAPSARRQGHGKTILKLGLHKAHDLGLKKALITTDEDNWASRKVIESNGGKLEGIVMGKIFPNPIARYWVDCD